MGKNNQLNTLLVEILIAVLFFALCATVILQTYVATRNQSRQAAIYDEALVEAQNTADRLYVSDNFVETLIEEGFTLEDDGWMRREELYELHISDKQEATDAGVLIVAQITAIQNEEALFSLPCTRYIPEVLP